ncbi:MAG: hypothetical protein KC609_22290, partial [Myxococcales bacterium]|nr:hypothetical protein [Myxococcales bacterium]
EWLEIARRRGLHYIAISDRLDRLSTPLSRYLSQLDALQKRAGTTRILRGIRLVLDGRPFPRDVLVELDRLDFIVGEPRLAQTDDEMANLARIVRSIDGAPFDCIVAPLQRRVRSRDAPPLDRSALCDEATRRGIAFGVVGDPERLDPDATFCRMAGERGIPLVLSSDPSVAADLDRIRFATVVARRGWVPHGRILNSWPIARLEQWRSAAGRRDAPIQTTESTASQRSGAALAQELASRPLDAALLARLRRYLEGEPDAELESALAVHGPNPLAAAFALIADRTNGD